MPYNNTVLVSPLIKNIFFLHLTKPKQQAKLLLIHVHINIGFIVFNNYIPFVSFSYNNALIAGLFMHVPSSCVARLYPIKITWFGVITSSSSAKGNLHSIVQ